MQQRTVVVIEDEASIASAVEARRRSEGFTVEIAADGPAGFALCHELRPRPGHRAAGVMTPTETPALPLGSGVTRPADARVLIAVAVAAVLTDLAVRSGVAGVAGTLLMVAVGAGATRAAVPAGLGHVEATVVRTGGGSRSSGRSPSA